MKVDNPILNFFRYKIQNYHPQKYWKRRFVIMDRQSPVSILLKYYYLFYIKRCDAFNNASFGTKINAGAVFSTAPNLPHGLNGIIIGDDAVIGANCVICQHVTVQWGGVVIGDNCYIGAGAVILAPSIIGNNVKIGANAVVKGNIPDNATVVPPKSRIIIRN